MDNIIDLADYIFVKEVPKLVKSYTTPDGITYIPKTIALSGSMTDWICCEVIINGFNIGEVDIIDKDLISHLVSKNEKSNNVYYYTDDARIHNHFGRGVTLENGTVWHSLINDKIYAVVEGLLLEITNYKSRIPNKLPNESELKDKCNIKSVIYELISIAMVKIKRSVEDADYPLSKKEVLQKCKLVNIPLNNIQRDESPINDILKIYSLTFSTVKLQEYVGDTIYPLRSNQYIGLKFSEKNRLSETYLRDTVTFDIYHRQNVTGEFKPTPYTYDALINPKQSDEENTSVLSVYEITGIPVKSLSSNYSYVGEWSSQFIRGNNIVFLSKNENDPPKPYVVYGVKSPPESLFETTNVVLYNLTTREKFILDTMMLYDMNNNLHDFIKWKFYEVQQYNTEENHE